MNRDRESIIPGSNSRLDNVSSYSKSKAEISGIEQQKRRIIAKTSGTEEPADYSSFS